MTKRPKHDCRYLKPDGKCALPAKDKNDKCPFGNPQFLGCHGYKKGERRNV